MPQLTEVQTAAEKRTSHHDHTALHLPSEARLDRNFRFAELTLAILLGYLLDKTSSTLKLNPDYQNFRAVLLVITLLLIAEMYIVLQRYHGRLGIVYDSRLLLFDVVIAFGIMTIVSLIVPTDTPPLKENSSELLLAMRLAAGGFLLLLLRQFISFCRIQNRAAVFAENHDLRKNLVVPMLANVIGCPIALCAAKSITRPHLGWSLVEWSWLALSAFVVYFIVMYVYKPDISMGGTRSALI